MFQICHITTKLLGSSDQISLIYSLDISEPEGLLFSGPGGPKNKNNTKKEDFFEHILTT